MHAAEETPAPRRQAVELFESGDYAAALPLLEQAVADAPDGPTLYRLYFAQARTRASGALDTMGRARDRLEAELEGSRGVQVPYFLAELYRASGKLSDAKRVAEQAASGIDGGTLPPPSSSADAYRLGKLYESLERMDDAANWFRKAVELAGDGPITPAVRGASRFLAERAFDAGDDAAAAKYYARLTEGDVTAEDLSRLAQLNIRRGEYLPAAAAWYKIVRLDPANGDQARYAAQLATQAEERKPLPATDPEGRPWAETPPGDLERLMLETVSEAQGLLDQAARLELNKARDWETQLKVWEIRNTFLAAALEFTMRGYPIRETAFQAGYAPMIFHSRRWRVEDVRRAREGR